MDIREATEIDFDQIWPIFHEIVSAGDTYAIDRNTRREEALNLWLHKPHKTFVVEDRGEILGTYYIKANHPGPGSHVCNCGYMVASRARGRGIATAMCEHSQQIARALGYKAMQYNLVVSTNTVAVDLWKRLGFEIVGRLPKAFAHPVRGYVDAFVMYKWLGASR
jgi:ribosomal protein S18 acetylase RimI-like enzyme